MRSLNFCRVAKVHAIYNLVKGGRFKYVVILGYGIAMTKGSGLKKNVSSAILMLQEEGTLEKLKQRWFLNATECLTGTKDADQESEDDTATRGENTKLNLMYGQNILIKRTIKLHLLATSDHFNF